MQKYIVEHQPVCVLGCGVIARGPGLCEVMNSKNFTCFNSFPSEGPVSARLSAESLFSMGSLYCPCFVCHEGMWTCCSEVELHS